jgi:hypothetical protein
MIDEEVVGAFRQDIPSEDALVEKGPRAIK